MQTCPVRYCKMPIEIGDLVYDRDYDCLGMVVEYVLNHGYHWIVEWNNGKNNWVDDDTVLQWKRDFERYKVVMNVR